MLNIEKIVLPSDEQLYTMVLAICYAEPPFTASDSWIQENPLDHVPHLVVGDNDLAKFAKYGYTVIGQNIYRRMLPVYIVMEADRKFWSELSISSWDMVIDRQFIKDRSEKKALTAVSTQTLRATVMCNYDSLAHLYYTKKDSLDDNWQQFCHVIMELPFANQLICRKNE